MVAESVEDLKNLVEKFAEPESYTVGRGKKTKVIIQSCKIKVNLQNVLLKEAMVT